MEDGVSFCRGVPSGQIYSTGTPEGMVRPEAKQKIATTKVHPEVKRRSSQGTRDMASI